MRKFNFLKECFMAVLAVFALTACSPSLESKVEEVNKQLPQTENGCTINRMSIEGNYLVIYTDFDEEVFRLDDEDLKQELRNNPSEMKSVWYSICAGDEDLADFTELCKNEKKGIRMIFHGEKSGETLTLLELEHSEL